MPFHQGLRKKVKNKIDLFATNLEDTRQRKGLAKREAAKAAELVARPAPIEQTVPRDVKLPQARPNPSASVLVGENPPVTGRRSVDQFQERTSVNNRAGGLEPIETRRGGVGPEGGRAAEKVAPTTLRHSDDVTGKTITDADLKAQNLARTKAAAIKGAQDVLANTKAFSAAQVKAAGELISSGAAAESIGGVVGRNVEGLSRGFNDVAAIEAEAPLKPAPIDDVVTKGPAEQPTLRPTEPVAPVEPAATQPKAQRTIIGRGLDAAARIPDRLVNKPITTGPPEPPKQRFGRTKAVAGTGLRVGGALAIPEIAAKVAGSVQRGTFFEDAERLLTDAPEMIGDLVRYITSDPAKAGKEAVNWVANLPNDVVAGLGSFNETVSGRNFDVPASGITGAPATNTFDLADQKPFGDLSIFDLDEDAPAPQQGQQLIDQSRAGDNRGLRTATAPTNNIAPAGNESFFINNNNTTPEHAGKAPGQKQFFHDIPQAFPQAQQGLRGAREELSSRNRFSDDPLANLAGEFAQARLSAEDRDFRQTERKNAATLAGAIGTASTTAETARVKANADLSTEYNEGLNAEDADTRERTKGRIFQDFRNQKRQGRLDANSAAVQATGAVITKALIDADNEGLLSRTWNSLTAPLGSGAGLLDLLDGDVSVDSGFPFDDMFFKGNELFARSADGATKYTSLGEFEDKHVLNFLRQSVRQSFGK